MLVDGGFCYERLLDESRIARESQNSPAPCGGEFLTCSLRPAPQRLCSREVQPFDQALQRLEILQAVDVFRAYLAASCGHGSHYGNFEPGAQLSPPSWIRWFLWFLCRKFRAEHSWDAALSIPGT
jgi:hypothetical protein